RRRGYEPQDLDVTRGRRLEVLHLLVLQDDERARRDLQTLAHLVLFDGPARGRVDHALVDGDLVPGVQQAEMHALVFDGRVQFDRHRFIAGADHALPDRAHSHGRSAWDSARAAPVGRARFAPPDCARGAWPGSARRAWPDSARPAWRDSA